LSIFIRLSFIIFQKKFVNIYIVQEAIWILQETIIFYLIKIKCFLHKYFLLFK